jgi:hypothetical protein
MGVPAVIEIARNMTANQENARQDSERARNHEARVKALEESHRHQQNENIRLTNELNQEKSKGPTYVHVPQPVHVSQPVPVSLLAIDLMAAIST